MDFAKICESGGMYAHHTRSEHPTANERHCHRRYELLFIVSGEGKATVEGVEYPLAPGSLFFFRPLEYHNVTPAPGTPYERYVINFSAADLVGAARDLPFLTEGNSPTYLSEKELPAGIPAAFRALDEESLSDDHVKEEPCAAAFLACVLTETVILLSHLRRSDAPRGMGDPLIRGITEYLSEHLSDEITLDLVARRFFVNKYTLCRIFREQIGTSLGDYLTEKRISRARSLLALGMPAGEVAERVGYRDYSAFYRAYRRRTGSSPSSRAEKGGKKEKSSVQRKD